MMITTTGPAHVNLAALGQIGLNINTWGHGQLINKKMMFCATKMGISSKIVDFNDFKNKLRYLANKKLEIEGS